MRILNEDRFFENHLTVAENGVAIPIRRVGYESHQHLFDVDLYSDGRIRYAIDCQTVLEPGPFHLAVMHHFMIFKGGETLFS